MTGNIIIDFLGYWFAASIVGTLIFVWLLKTKRIGFEPITDSNQFTHEWERRS